MVRLNVLIGIEKITGCSVPQANEQNRPIVPWTSSPRLKKTIIKKLTKKEYFVRGCTALLDAVGGAIHHIGNIHKYARDEDRPEKTLFIITTDGMENASHSYTYAKVKKMVERQKEKYGWEFLFLGANMDAIETAGHIGIHADRAVTYECDEEGTALNFDVMSEAVSHVRCCKTALGAGWKSRIEEDVKRRGKSK